MADEVKIDKFFSIFISKLKETCSPVDHFLISAFKTSSELFFPHTGFWLAAGSGGISWETSLVEPKLSFTGFKDAS